MSAPSIDVLAGLLDANDIERATLQELSRALRHGAQSVDLVIRKDGQTHVYSFDLLCRALRHPLLEIMAEWFARISPPRESAGR